MDTVSSEGIIYQYVNIDQYVFLNFKGPRWPSGFQVWHLITGCHLCVGSTPTSGNAEDLPQYDPVAVEWHLKTPTNVLNFNVYTKV